MEDIIIWGDYSLPSLIIGMITIFVIGCLKIFKIFTRINNKTIKKSIYYTLVICLSFIGSIIYYKIYNKPFNIDFAYYALTLTLTTTTLYAIYENFGLRNLLQFIFKKIALAFASRKAKKETIKGGLTLEETEFIDMLTNMLTAYKELIKPKEKATEEKTEEVTEETKEEQPKEEQSTEENLEKKEEKEIEEKIQY